MLVDLAFIFQIRNAPGHQSLSLLKKPQRRLL